MERLLHRIAEVRVEVQVKDPREADAQQFQDSQNGVVEDAVTARPARLAVVSAAGRIEDDAVLRRAAGPPSVMLRTLLPVA